MLVKSITAVLLCEDQHVCGMESASQTLVTDLSQVEDKQCGS